MLRLHGWKLEWIETDLRRDTATCMSDADESTGPTLPAGSIADTTADEMP